MGEGMVSNSANQQPMETKGTNTKNIQEKAQALWCIKNPTKQILNETKMGMTSTCKYTIEENTS